MFAVEDSVIFAVLGEEMLWELLRPDLEAVNGELLPVALDRPKDRRSQYQSLA